MSSQALMWATVMIAGEILFIMVAVTIYSVTRKNRGHAAMPDAHLSPAKTTVPTAQIPVGSSYLEAEIKRTREALLSRNENALNDVGNAELLALNLRLQMLQLEHKVSQTESGKRNIRDIESGVGNILRHMKITHALDIRNKKISGRDDQETQGLIERQNQTIEFLKRYTREILDKILKQNADFINSQQGPEDIIRLSHAHNEFMGKTDELMLKVDQLESCNTELTQCVAVLEDENQFLRDQIAALLLIVEKNK